VSSPAGTFGRVVVLLVTMVIAAACGSSGGRTETVAPSGSAAPSTTSTPSVTVTANAVECGQVLAAGTELAAQLTGFVQGQTTLDQLTAAATQLLDTVNATMAAVGDAYRDTMTQLQSELQALQSALQQSPPQPASIRAAGQTVVSTLATLARPCISATPTGS
jgi:hypothetical protein